MVARPDPSHRVDRGAQATHSPGGLDPPRTKPQLLRLGAVAQCCQVSLRTVQCWVAAGRLRVVRLGGRVVRVEEAALEEFLDPGAGGPAVISRRPAQPAHLTPRRRHRRPDRRWRRVRVRPGGEVARGRA